ncbi:EAL domain-containing protein [Aliidiomarina soli]|uniref:cyclic-guanylate-specific phosphodiesterase n=1 Tax=Aliidiomarina soli TaxID=1928574 RepID=A0A432WLV1_9GAMM|nr:EAL domain-containing protein [Aliidiomarina soli]RUO34796.1 hypothetical protein CWE14_02015 [Aliidiomarina soli]
MKINGFWAKASGLVMFIILMFAVHALTKLYQRNVQDEFSQELLSHAELVSSQLMQAIRSAKENEIADCTDENIDQLRKIANQYLYVYDLGIVASNQVRCTANWGIFNPPAALPDTYYQVASEFQLYSQAESIFPIPQSFDISRFRDVVAFTVDFSFQHFVTKDHGFSYSIEMANRQHNFLNYQSEESDTPLSASASLGLFKVVTTRCSQRFGYCVYTESNRGGVFYFSAAVILLLFIISLAFSFVVAYAVQSYLYKQNSMEFRFRRAIHRKLIKVEYQPILQADTRRIIGVESLVRWRDPVYGSVSPELFISIADKLGIYKDLTYHIAAVSIAEMTPVLKQNKEFFVSLNVTSFEVLDENFLLFLKNKVESSGLATRQIKIEMTEEISVPLDTLSKFSKQARKYGFRISLDDFGTGVANLVWLTEIAFDDIKIDRVFTQALNDKFKEKMVFSIIEMVSSLRRQVTFEGVETQGELDVILQYFSSAHVQGWYFYKSLSINSLLKVLKYNELNRS